MSSPTPHEALEYFLTTHRAAKVGPEITHTKVPGGKYHIPDEDLEEFYQKYGAVIEASPQPDLLPRLTEKPRYYSPVRIDLDFRYYAMHAERRYTPEMIENFLVTFMGVMESWLSLTDMDRLCFVTEKPSAVVDVRRPKNDEGMFLVKDGVHLFFANLLVPMELQLRFREEMLKLADGIFVDMDLSNAMHDVIDKAVIDKNNWMLYKSRKPRGEPYSLTGVYHVTGASATPTEEEFSTAQLVRLMSVRSETVDQAGGDDLPATRVMCQILQEKQAELDEHLKEYKIRAGKSFAPKGGRKKKCKPTKKSDEEMVTIRELIGALSPKRADTYELWMQVGWALHNIDERLIEDWVVFSKQASQYAHESEDACRKAWDEMRDEGLGYGSLCHWANQDNHEVYTEIKRREIQGQILKSMNKYIDTENDKLNESLREMRIQPYDVAQVLYARFKDEFTCIDTRNKHGTYYHFDGHRWQSVGGYILLWQIISDDIPKMYLSLLADISKQANSGDKESQEVMGNWVSEKDNLKRLVKTLDNMNTTCFKNNVMQEAMSLFFDTEPKVSKRFTSMLDEKNKHLVGFDNGIYDLERDEFRPGRPEDYVSMSTNIEYEPDLDWDDERVEEVMQFVDQVLPDEDEREYVLTLLGSFLNGNNRNEKFHIWTGSGGNGKSKIIELYQLAIGDYGCNIPISLLTHARKDSGSASSEVARTKGRRFAVLQEPDVHTRINVGLMKEMTGGDTIQARMIYQEPIEFKPQIKMVLTCNHLPELPYDDEATWRRVRSVEFKSRFVDVEDVNPSDKYSHPKDEELSEKFQEWKEPLMWILIQYYDKWRTKGLREPKSVIAFTEQYKAQNDQFRDFFDEYLIKDTAATEPVQFKEIWQKYTEWCNQNGESGKRKRQELLKYLEKKLGEHHGIGKEHSGWKGYRLKQCYVDDDDDGSLSHDLDL